VPLRPRSKDRPRRLSFNYLYWDFIDHHLVRFCDHPRMKNVVLTWLKRSAADQESIRASAKAFLATL
jgi:deoxyribodipyrimidine photolyase-like uncharacterized protein